MVRSIRWYNFLVTFRRGRTKNNMNKNRLKLISKTNWEQVDALSDSELRMAAALRFYAEIHKAT